MKRLVLAAAAAAMLLTIQPASAHTPDFVIVGFQYTAFYQMEDFPNVPAGYLNLPTGAMEQNEGAFADRTVGSIVNRDAIPHTFTEYNAACAQYGDCTDSRFMIALPGNSAASQAKVDALNALIEEDLLLKGAPQTYLIMCQVHRYMRAKLTVTGD